MTTTEIVKAEEIAVRMAPIVGDLVDTAKRLSHIIDEKSFGDADRFVSNIKKAQKELEDRRFAITRPIDKMKKDVKGYFDPLEKQLSQAEMIIKGATRKWWIAEQERKAKEKKEKEEAERKRLEDEKLSKAVELEKHGNVSQAEKVLNKETIVSPQQVETSFDNSKTYGRKTWRCKIVDTSEFLNAIADGKIPMDFIEVKYSQMNRAASAMKGQVNWPGVKAIEDVIMGVRR